MQACALLIACKSAEGSSKPVESTPALAASAGASSAAPQPTAAAAAGGAGSVASAPPQAGARAGSQVSAAAGSPAAGKGAAGAPGVASAGAGGAAPTSVAGSGGVSAAAGAAAGGSGGSAGNVGSAGQAAVDASSFASGLSELFIDAACDSATRAPLEEGATCNHPPGMQRIEKLATFGGAPGTSYKLTLRVRGIWEPTNVSGGMRPYEDVPFTIGGQVASGAGSSSDSINYQQYFIEIAEPKQTYWLNDYQYVAHDIHKEDYEASLTVAGGAQIKVVMNDGNEREIANFPKEMFADVPPYDKMPSLGQSLRLDVVSVEPLP